MFIVTLSTSDLIVGDQEERNTKHEGTNSRDDHFGRGHYYEATNSAKWQFEGSRMNIFKEWILLLFFDFSFFFGPHFWRI